METQKYCSVRVSGPKNQNGGFPQNLPGRFTSVCSVIQVLFRDISSLPVTQVTVERLFSSLKFIKNDLRSSLKDDIIDHILFLRHNFKNFFILQYKIFLTF